MCETNRSYASGGIDQAELADSFYIHAFCIVQKCYHRLDQIELQLFPDSQWRIYGQLPQSCSTCVKVKTIIKISQDNHSSTTKNVT